MCYILQDSPACDYLHTCSGCIKYLAEPAGRDCRHDSLACSASLTLLLGALKHCSQSTCDCADQVGLREVHTLRFRKIASCCLVLPARSMALALRQQFVPDSSPDQGPCIILCEEEYELQGKNQAAVLFVVVMPDRQGLLPASAKHLQ